MIVSSVFKFLEAENEKTIFWKSTFMQETYQGTQIS